MNALAPPHIVALLDAYIAETGLRVSLSNDRRWALKQMHDRGITPEDVRAVLRTIKKKGNSILFSNAMKPDVIEEKALLLKQQAARMKGARPRPQVPRTDALGVTRLDDAPAPEPKRADVAKALQGLAEEIGGGGR